MRLAVALLKQSASSARWTARQANDPYVRLRSAGSDKRDVYRSRSAFKLVSLSRKYPSLLARGSLVVDLGAAPGGWSQVASTSVGKLGRVWAVDMLAMEDIQGVEILCGNFLDQEVHTSLASSVALHRRSPTREEDVRVEEEDERGLVDTVLSDMMAPMSGVRLKDVQASLDLVEAATGFAKGVLKYSDQLTPSMEDSKTRRYAGGSLVLKYFAHPDLDHFKRTQLDPFFAKVFVDKPKESRKESSEAYWVCLGYRGNHSHVS